MSQRRIARLMTSRNDSCHGLGALIPTPTFASKNHSSQQRKGREGFQGNNATEKSSPSRRGGSANDSAVVQTLQTHPRRKGINTASPGKRACND